ncbi:class II aldolase/adducin family protein [Vagococcus sp. BWB3-3]|uniref:L-ribulose-5-phosphate 4-epimerase n=1 Tax=Vagococcus allomyrinae TaxID=2794353 RepID=A0A940P8L4_9ENTE|nr:L-ribulose-5-phosphate 4-epimerase [Vagococcus allomyrinae]MBP1039947.1 class II aldolase/adducin family protein [Vagococcus allomyrinae]
MLESIKEAVCFWNKSLKEQNLVKWTSGNVSYRDPETGYVTIKPSGVAFDQLTPEKMVVVDLEGTVIEGEYQPSVDTQSHLYTYREMPAINSIVHTHSPFATSFAIRGVDLPTYTTTGANLFGERVKCTEFAIIGEAEIGKQIVKYIGQSSAILLRNHGVFTVGATIEKAIKAAVILEETAEYAHYATLHNPEIPVLDGKIVAASHQFYQTSYGQK